MLDVMEQDRAFLAEKDARIFELEARISALRAANKSAREQLNSYKYPVTTLPSKIVREVFLYMAPSYPYLLPLIARYSPLLLTQVCSQWRKIAHETPALWRAIDLTLSRKRQTSIDARLATFLASSWLARSSSLPLSIRYDDRHADGVSLSLISTLVPHRCCFEYLMLYVSGAQLNTIAGPMPVLRELHLHLQGTEFDAVTFHSQDLPLLRALRLESSSPLSITFPWSQLTSLELKRLHSHDYMSALKQTSQLVHLKLDVFAPDTPLVETDIVLPYLESLVIENTIDTNRALLGLLVTPGLVRLQLHEHSLQGYTELARIESLAAFVVKSGCQLCELEITESVEEISEEALCEAFSSIPTVKIQLSPEYEDEYYYEYAFDDGDSDCSWLE
ncbi:F-box domain-containing protein [Favolaschia claudopus]|uniref:F-box domain-containing protein n=1 Tax=Favolaschia claudopus TaxID=2862362 RepID=A0AAW0E1N5_9AGAR